MDEFTRAYLTCALWSSNDESTPSGGESFDANYSIEDIAPSAIAEAIEDCNEFRKLAGDLLTDYWDDSQAGHDFWLTRNHHGAGFWDRYCDFYGENKDSDLIKKIGEKLTDICQTNFKECCPYLGNDGLIYL